MLKNRIIIIFLCFLLFIFSFISVNAENKKLESQLPNDLVETYKKFIIDMKTGVAGSIDSYCLPQAISFTYNKRKNRPGIGQDINTHWAVNGFKGKIISIRKKEKGCFLIRTATTAMWFINTKHMGWRLYEYLDKPIK
ncbi:MAG: hypothetical protein H8E98_01220 [Bacteroidetes bacterium]|nr:hypothetical protein [Bacteroidota bacterium]